MTQRFISYARNLEDVMLWRAFGRTLDSPGFYVDLGAGDPAGPSVTYAFYDRGWRGLDLEPRPDHAARLQEARPRDVVVQGEAAAASTHGTTLAALCRDHVRGPVHFLRIGGAQDPRAALAGADWAACRPWVVLAEVAATVHQSPDDAPDWEPGLREAGYRFVWFDGLSRFYLAQEHAGLARHFRVQPNLTDAYVVEAPSWRLHLETVERLAADRKELLDRLQAQLAAMAAAAHPALPLPEAGPRSRTLVRRAAMALYRLVRPVARPLAYRSRHFLVAPLIEQLADIRSRQAEAVTRQDKALRQLDALQAWSRQPPAIDPALGSTMERLLLTLALQEPPDTAPSTPPTALPTDRTGG